MEAAILAGENPQASAASFAEAAAWLGEKFWHGG
jgi:hypothetical protein